MKHDLRLPLFTLACASTIGIALIAVRIVVSFHVQHLNLVWNLFLAWIPLLLALRVESLERRGVSRGEFWLTVGAWLLFFPNAPYILTDLTHLKHIVNARWWTDLIIILFFALIGLVLGFISLHRMQAVVARRRGSLVSWAFVFGVAFLSGFGVYLGRFERWNSWDVVMNPVAMLADSINWLHRQPAKFTLLFGLFLFTAYALLYSLTRLGTLPPAEPSES